VLRAAGAPIGFLSYRIARIFVSRFKYHMISDNEMGLFVFVFVFVFRWLLSLPSRVRMVRYGKLPYDTIR